MEHIKDSDCTVDETTGCCSVCGVDHNVDLCPDCSRQGFHNENCPRSDATIESKWLGYRETIRQDLARLGHVGMDPRAVEAWMRLEHSTLDGLDKRRWLSEIKVAVQCIKAAPEQSARLIRSMGLS